MATRITGIPNMKANLAKVRHDLPTRGAAALYAEAEAIMAISKPRAPVLTGVMRASGYVAQPTTAGGTISVEMGYGGAAQDYVVPQHEDLTLRHNAGTGAKFLEGPLKEAAPGLADRIAQRINLG